MVQVIQMVFMVAGLSSASNLWNCHLHMFRYIDSWHIQMKVMLMAIWCQLVRLIVDKFGTYCWFIAYLYCFIKQLLCLRQFGYWFNCSMKLGLVKISYSHILSGGIVYTLVLVFHLFDGVYWLKWHIIFYHFYLVISMPKPWHCSQHPKANIHIDYLKPFTYDINLSLAC